MTVLGVDQSTISPIDAVPAAIREHAVAVVVDERALTPADAPSILTTHRREASALDGFTLTYEGFEPVEEGLREALTSTGNGYLCTRGAAEWEDADAVHYPGTYAHGVYNRETTILGGRPVLNEDLVNLPNWLVLKLRIDGEDAVRLGEVELLEYRHELDIRDAVVVRALRFRDRAGRETTLRSRRFVSMADVHHAGLEWTLEPENWSGRVEIVSAIDGRMVNRGVPRYEQLEGRHIAGVGPRTFGPEVIALKVETRQSNVYVSEAARTACSPPAFSSTRIARSTRWTTTSNRCSRSTCAKGRRCGSRSS